MRRSERSTHDLLDRQLGRYCCIQRRTQACERRELRNDCQYSAWSHLLHRRIRRSRIDVLLSSAGVRRGRSVSLLERGLRFPGHDRHREQGWHRDRDRQQHTSRHQLRHHLLRDLPSRNPGHPERCTKPRIRLAELERRRLRGDGSLHLLRQCASRRDCHLHRDRYRYADGAASVILGGAQRRL